MLGINNISVIKNSQGSLWRALYYYLKSGDIWYRREINNAGGYFSLDYSEDAGVTWEELIVEDLTEPSVLIDLTHVYRHRIVDYAYHVDQTLTATGYAGTENTDWENLYVTSGAWTPQRTSSGLIFKTDFESIDDWTNDGTFSKISDDALISFDPIPLYFNNPVGGSREVTLFKEGSKLTLVYDVAVKDVSVVVPHYSESTDGGKTWVAKGILGPGYSKGGGGTWVGVAGGYTTKIDGKYYTYRVCADTVGSAPNDFVIWDNYVGEVWSADTIDGVWTFKDQTDTFANTWAHKLTLPGNVIKVGSTYYLTVQGYTSGTVPAAGFYTSTTPYGPWTLVPTTVLTTAILGDSRWCENPKVFFHPTLNKYVFLTNTYIVANAYPDFNYVQISDNIDDWVGVSLRRYQSSYLDMDAITNKPIGVPTQVVNSDNEVVIGNNNFIPMIYDCEGTAYTPGYHYGRKGKIVLLEPSRNTIRFDGSASGAIRKIQSNTDFVVEFGVQFDSYTASELVGFIFRSDGSGDNEYILQVQNGGDKLKLIKKVAGTPTTIETGIASQVIYGEMINRIKVVCSGTSIKAYSNGQLQIDSTDAAFSTGTHIGFAGGGGANTDIRLLQIRGSDTVTITGLPEGTEVELIADGGICAASTIANSSGIASFVLSHWPMESYTINGVNYPITDGIYGGDSYSYTKSLPAKTENTIVSTTVEEASPKNIVVTFTNALDETTWTDTSAFTIAGKTVSSITIAGSVVTVIVSAGFAFGDTPSLVYARPYSAPLRSDPDTSYIDSFTQVVTNNITTIASDLFTDTNGVSLDAHAMDVGGGWTEVSGNWSINTNKAICAINDGVLSYSVTTTLASDVEVSAEITMPAVAYYAAGIMMRYADATHFWIVELERDNGVPYVKLVEVSTIRGSVNVTQENGVSKRLKAVCNNESIKVYWGADLLIDYATASASKTNKKHGICGYTATVSYANLPINDFLIEQP